MTSPWFYTICTGTLDKGGIDHTPSSFRAIKVDANNNISTELRYAFIEPQIAIVSPMDNQTAASSAAASTSENQLPVSVNTYHSQAKTSHVSYVLSDAENNQEIAKGNLTSLTDWNWNGNIQIPTNENGKRLHLTVSSFFNDEHNSLWKWNCNSPGCRLQPLCLRRRIREVTLETIY